MTARPDLDEMYARLNAKHFGGALPSVPLVVGMPEWHRTGAPMSTIYNRETGEVVGIHFHERLRWDKYDALADLLLHEMVHVALFIEVGGHKHDEVFVARCNAIGDAMGWPRCVLPDDAEMSHDGNHTAGLGDCRLWPSDRTPAVKVSAAAAKRARRAAKRVAR